MGQDWLKPEMRCAACSLQRKQELRCPFFCYFINSNENDSAKVTISCKNLFSLCDNIEVTIFLLRLFPSPIIGSHHRGWRQTWQKIRWRVMCLPVVLEVSWLWSTKMESFLMLSLHSRYLLSARAVTLPLVTVISQSDGKRESRKKIISSPNLCCWCNKLRDSNYSGSREYPWESQKMTELPSDLGN